MNKVLKENKDKILQDIANPDNVVLSQTPRYPGAPNFERIFKLADKNNATENNSTMFEIRFVLPGISQYVIALPNKPIISRIIHTDAKWHRPVARDILEIYTALRNKRLYQQTPNTQIVK